MKENLETKLQKDPYKSEGERKIAQFLTKTGIDFIYEKETLIKDQNKVKIWYPDFTLPQYHIIIEYYGINGKPEYTDAVRYKQKAYEENQLDVIPIYPEHLQNNYQDRIIRNINQILYRRIYQFQNTFKKASTNYKKR
jgi:hypothetical protein